MASAGSTSFASSARRGLLRPRPVDVGHEQPWRPRRGADRAACRRRSPRPARGSSARRGRASRTPAGRSRGSRGTRRWPCRPRIARAAALARAAEHVRRPFADHVHVGRSGVHVGRRDVGAVQRIHELRVREEQIAALGRSPLRHRRDGQHRLAAAVREVRGGLLERHRSREPEPVGERVLGRRRRPSSACRPSRDRGRSSGRRSNIQAPVAASNRMTTSSPSQPRSSSSNIGAQSRRDEGGGPIGPPPSTDARRSLLDETAKLLPLPEQYEGVAGVHDPIAAGVQPRAGEPDDTHVVVMRRPPPSPSARPGSTARSVPTSLLVRSSRSG